MNKIVTVHANYDGCQDAAVGKEGWLPGRCCGQRGVVARTLLWAKRGGYQDAAVSKEMLHANEGNVLAD